MEGAIWLGILDLYSVAKPPPPHPPQLQDIMEALLCYGGALINNAHIYFTAPEQMRARKMQRVIGSNQRSRRSGHKGETRETKAVSSSEAEHSSLTSSSSSSSSSSSGPIYHQKGAGVLAASL